MEASRIVYENSHGSGMFPFSVWNSKNHGKGLVVYNNCHDDLEFLYVEKGTLSFKVNLSNYDIHEGEAALLNKGEIHSGSSLEDFCFMHAITFNLNMLYFKDKDICQTNFLDPIYDGRLKFPSYITGKYEWETEVLNSIRRILLLYYNKEIGYELLIKAELYRIFGVLYSYHAFVTTNNDISTSDRVKIERLKSTLKYIEENYMGKIHIRDLANESKISECYFMKLFHELTGRTPIEYINSYRIRKAEELMHDQNLSIIDVSMSVGFDSVSYFDRQFRSVHGCTPKEYRKKLFSN